MKGDRRVLRRVWQAISLPAISVSFKATFIPTLLRISSLACLEFKTTRPNCYVPSYLLFLPPSFSLTPCFFFFNHLFYPSAPFFIISFSSTLLAPFSLSLSLFPLILLLLSLSLYFSFLPLTLATSRFTPQQTDTMVG